jgi:hypothetical protein
MRESGTRLAQAGPTERLLPDAHLWESNQMPLRNRCFGGWGRGKGWGTRLLAPTAPQSQRRGLYSAAPYGAGPWRSGRGRHPRHASPGGRSMSPLALGDSFLHDRPDRRQHRLGTLTFSGYQLQSFPLSAVFFLDQSIHFTVFLAKCVKCTRMKCSAAFRFAGILFDNAN